MSVKTFVTGAAFALAAAASSGALAHAKLASSDPQAGSTVPAAPRALRLQFSEPLEAAFSKFTVLDSRNTATPVQRVASDTKTLAGTLPALAPGDYRVQWSVVTRDGHTAKGEFAFKVR